MIILVEKTQRRSTKLPTSLRNKSYEERLEVFGLTTLEEWRLWGDMIEIYKILTDKEDIPKDMFFELAPDSVTRCHHLKIMKKTCPTKQQETILLPESSKWLECPPCPCSAGLNSLQIQETYMTDTEGLLRGQTRPQALFAARQVAAKQRYGEWQSQLVHTMSWMSGTLSASTHMLLAKHGNEVVIECK